MLKYIPEIQRVRALWGSRGLSLGLAWAMNTQVPVHTWPLWPARNSLSTFTPPKGHIVQNHPVCDWIVTRLWPLQSPVDSFWLYMGIPKRGIFHFHQKITPTASLAIIPHILHYLYLWILLIYCHIFKNSIFSLSSRETITIQHKI